MKIILIALFVFSVKLPFAQAVHSRTIRYDLTITDSVVNYAGKNVKTMVINGSIPGPVLNFTEGDTAEIYVHNKMMMETSIHWHGIIVPNRYDGVSYLTTAPIKGGQSHLFKFPIVQNGTYWYHSHTMFQQQGGLYGAIVIHKKQQPAIKEYTLLLSDWTNENPDQVNRRLHNATDWYSIKKGSTQDYVQAIKEGYLKTKLKNEWKRMLAMDVSDVYYDRFLANGKQTDVAPQFKPGEKVRVRIINGSSSTYFWLNYSGGKMTVVANDGKDVEPVPVDKMIIAAAETYDVIITIPDNGSYQLLATAEDRTKSTSLWLGQGSKMFPKPLGKLKYFEGMKMMNGMMKMNGDMNDMGMKMSNQVMDMNTVMYPENAAANVNDTSKKLDSMPGMKMETMNDDGPVVLNYNMLRSPDITTLPEGNTRTFRFDLTGNMNRYVWSINNRTVSESEKILIKKGENIRIILYNGTMMRHPMHLHGHFFRVLNGQGDHAPLKNVLDIMPMETDTLEFAATESGDWFFHCHILYHMMSGMGRIFSYENSPPNPEIPDPEKALKMVYMDDKMPHLMTKASFETNGSDGEVALANTRFRLQTEWRIGLNTRTGYESESHFGRYLGKMQFWYPYIGWDYRYRKYVGMEKNFFGQINDKNNRKAFCAGVQYTLPMLLIADTRIATDGKIRFQLSREDIAVSNRLRLALMWNTDKEYMAGLKYVVTKYFSFSTHYDSDMGYGVGVTLNY